MPSPTPMYSERLLPAPRLDQPTEERREEHGSRSQCAPVDADGESHSAMEPARDDHRQQHGERGVPHRAHEQTVEEIELPELGDRADENRADGDQDRRADHERPRAVAVAEPAHRDRRGQPEQERERVGERDVAALPAEHRNERVDEHGEGRRVGPRGDAEHTRRDEDDPRVVKSGSCCSRHCSSAAATAARRRTPPCVSSPRKRV